VIKEWIWNANLRLVGAKGAKEVAKQLRGDMEIVQSRKLR